MGRGCKKRGVGLTPLVGWLRESHRCAPAPAAPLPFVFKRLPHGKLFFTLDIDLLSSFLDVTSKGLGKQSDERSQKGSPTDHLHQL